MQFQFGVSYGTEICGAGTGVSLLHKNGQHPYYHDKCHAKAVTVPLLKSVTRRA